MSQFGIVYGVASKAVRRIIISDDPNYDYSIHVKVGEAYVLSDTKGGTDIFAARAAVEAATGKKSLVPLVAVVKDSTVVSVILADPLLDEIEGYELISAYEGVSEGCIYDKANSTFTTPSRFFPAGVDAKGNLRPAEKVDATVVPQPLLDVDIVTNER